MFITGWCANSNDTSRKITFTFAVPKVIERLRVEKTANGAYPTVISLKYSNRTGVPLIPFTATNITVSYAINKYSKIKFLYQ